MPPLLSGDAVETALTDLPGWTGDADGIRRSVDFESFPAAVAFVQRVAVTAEAAEHHPDIDIRWRTVVLALSTHSEGGVTQLDLDLAATVDALV